VFFREVGFDDLGRLLTSVQVAAYGGQDGNLVACTALAQAIGLHILVEQFIGIEFGAIPGNKISRKRLVFFAKNRLA
jgi:hypothetical protein